MAFDRSTLREVGEALFGPSWQTPLADELISPATGRPVNLRTVQRWAHGDTEIPESVWPSLAELARKRGKALERIAAKLEKGAT
jgi:hypothetical protein